MSETLSMAFSPPNTATFSFDALYRESAADVRAYAWGLLRDRAAAEDVTALAFERAYRRRDRFDAGRGSARAWLFAIVRNAALAAPPQADHRADLRPGRRARARDPRRGA